MAGSGCRGCLGSVTTLSGLCITAPVTTICSRSLSPWAAIAVWLVYVSLNSLLSIVTSSLPYGEPQTWLTIPFWNNFFLMVVLIWIQTGFAMVILSAALRGIPEETIEAAIIDGANPFQVFFKIKVPQIMGTIVVVWTTITILVLKVFDIVYTMTGGNFDTEILPDIQAALRQGGWAVTVAVHKQRDVIAVWPGFKPDLYGLAVDIGSPTIAAHLCSLASGDVIATGGIMNPQIRFGEDLMSRVSYSMMNPTGAAEMTAAVREGMNALFAQVTADAQIDANLIVDAVFVCNPVMHHLFLGIDAYELGQAPFALATSESLSLRATELDLNLHPAARVYILPCIAGHVGANAAAVALSEAPDKSEDLMLVVDVGTNAEIVIGNRDWLACAACSAGPASR